VSMLKPLRPRKCNCLACQYCKDRNRYERDRSIIMERMRIRRILERNREAEISLLSVDELLDHVRRT
jgi:hypothetical protein